jgi:hypothetical protein
LYLEILAVPERQGRDESGLNFHTGKDPSAEIQTNFNVVILFETAVNRFVFGDFAVSRDENLPRYRRVELPLTSGELDLRYSPVVILVEFGNLRRVLHRQRQCRLKAARAWTNGETAQAGIMRRRILKRQ